MIQDFATWVIRNWVEIFGTLLGTTYVFLSIKQNILTWLMGFLTSVLYIYVFFHAKFYADMALQGYYVWISIYGWWLWSKGKTAITGHSVLPVSQLKPKLALLLGVISIVLWAGIYFILKNYTDSPVPFGDAFTTALSIVATWMLARKIIEHWLIWVVVDFISLMLYLYKGLYPTSVLFFIYTGAAIWGYFEWKKEITLTHE